MAIIITIATLGLIINRRICTFSRKHDSLFNFRYDIFTVSNNEMNIFQLNLLKDFLSFKTYFVIKQNALPNLRLTCL